jgi:site-specific recombinase XerD
MQAAIHRANAALIEEFVAQAEVTDSTLAKYRAHLREFAHWYEPVAGPDARLVEARVGDVSRFMAYLRSGDRFAATRSPRTAQRPAASTRKSIFASVGSFYRYLARIPHG